MSWKSGSLLADKIWEIATREAIHIEEEIKAQMALEIVEAFQSEDCSNMYECDFVNKYLKYNEDTNEWEIKR